MNSKKIISLLLLSVALSSSLYAEIQATSSFDSLLVKLTASNENTDKVILLNNLSWQLMKQGKYAKAKKFCSMASLLSRKLNYSIGEANAFNNIGNIYY